MAAEAIAYNGEGKKGSSVRESGALRSCVEWQSDGSIRRWTWTVAFFSNTAKVVGDTFMGCTGSGTPKMTPVSTLKKPEKTRVESRLMDPWTARAIMSGSRVPRSPSAPEISDSGDSLSVARLWRVARRRSADRRSMAGTRVGNHGSILPASTAMSIRSSLSGERGDGAEVLATAPGGCRGAGSPITR